MFPYEKQRLINYRFALGWTAVLFCVCVAVGVWLQNDSGWAFSAMQAYAVLPLALRLLEWSPEPTAARQIFAAMAVHTALAVTGYFLVNWTIGRCLA